MKKILFLSAFVAALALSVVSCGGNGSATQEVAADTTVTVDSLIANIDQFVGDTVYVEGVCSHLCSHGGKKAFLVGEDENMLIRCESQPYMDGPFPADCIKKVLVVKGIVVEDRIDEEVLASWEATIDPEQEHVSGCDTERKAVGQENLTSLAERIADYRTRIAKKVEEGGNPWISQYHIDAISFTAPASEASEE